MPGSRLGVIPWHIAVGPGPTLGGGTPSLTPCSPARPQAASLRRSAAVLPGRWRASRSLAPQDDLAFTWAEAAAIQGGRPGFAVEVGPMVLRDLALPFISARQCQAADVQPSRPPASRS